MATLKEILHKLAHPSDHDLHALIDDLEDDPSSSTSKKSSGKGGSSDA